MSKTPYFGVPHFSGFINLLSRNLPNTFVDFQNCQFLTKLKITLSIGQKVVWQQFKNEKTEMYKIFVFSRWLSWNVTSFPENLSNGSKLAHNTEIFSDFNFFENLRTHFASFWALEQLFKIIWYDQKLCLVKLIVMVYWKVSESYK